jgi:hypothetical protein
MDPETKAAFAALAKLVEDYGQSLQGEMHSLRADMQLLRTDMESGFERVEAATRRNSTTIAGGAAAIAALNRWARQRDQIDSKRDRDLRDLRARMLKVERALKRRAG